MSCHSYKDYVCSTANAWVQMLGGEDLRLHFEIAEKILRFCVVPLCPRKARKNHYNAVAAPNANKLENKADATKATKWLRR